jgi:DnaK suppressor protein
MTNSQLNIFKEMLEARHAELISSSKKRDQIAIQRAPDILDEVQFSAERELAVRDLDRGARLWRDIRAALARIQDGEYGLCAECEQEIGAKRLNALPYASLCIRCQEESDRTRKSTVRFDMYSLPDAA